MLVGSRRDGEVGPRSFQPFAAFLPAGYTPTQGVYRSRKVRLDASSRGATVPGSTANPPGRCGSRVVWPWSAAPWLAQVLPVLLEALVEGEPSSADNTGPVKDHHVEARWKQ